MPALLRVELEALRAGLARRLAAGLLALVALASAVLVVGMPAARIDGAGVRTLLDGAARAAVLAALALGVAGVAGRAARARLGQLVLAAPTRWPVVAVRAGVRAAAAAVLGVAAVVVAVLVAAPLARARGAGFEVVGTPVGEALLGVPVACACCGALGVGLASALRDSPWTLAALLAWIGAVELTLPDAVPDLGRFLPGGALGALTGAGEGLPDGIAALLLAAYAVAALAAGAVALARRDLLEPGGTG
jgi:ABC-2 type transport system permease protein